MQHKQSLNCIIFFIMKWLIIYNPFPNRCFNWLAFPQVPRVSNFKTFTNFSQPHSIKHSYTRAALVGRERRCVNLCHVCRLIENPWEHLSPWCQSVVPTSDSTEEVIWIVYNSAIMNREQQVDNVGRLWYCVCLSVCRCLWVRTIFHGTPRALHD